MPEPTESTPALPTPVEVPIAKVLLISVPGGVPNLDAPLEELIRQSPDMATRVRIPLSLYDSREQNYDGWNRVAWVLEMREQRLAATFREDLDVFIREWADRHA